MRLASGGLCQRGRDLVQQVLNDHTTLDPLLNQLSVPLDAAGSFKLLVMAFNADGVALTDNGITSGPVHSITLDGNDLLVELGVRILAQTSTLYDSLGFIMSLYIDGVQACSVASDTAIAYSGAITAYPTVVRDTVFARLVLSKAYGFEDDDTFLMGGGTGTASVLPATMASLLTPGSHTWQVKIDNLTKGADSVKAFNQFVSISSITQPKLNLTGVSTASLV